VLRPVFAIGDWVDEVLADPIPLGTGITGWVVANRQTRNVPNVCEEPLSNVVAGTLDEPEAFVCVPLLTPERVLGALNVHRNGADVVFQPVVELATGRAGGFEALARFEREPRRGPEEWFAQAHRVGLGEELEALALRAALAVRGRPEGTFLALNVSPRALLSAPVRAALPDDLTGIVIELTEHEVFGADGVLEGELAALRARGAQVALDDAGAGYAGLQQIIRIAPDILKLDRALVHDGLARPASGWPSPAPEATRAGEARIEAGLRVAGAPRGGAAAFASGLAELADDLARATSVNDLRAAHIRAGDLLGADDVALMRVDRGTNELVLLSQNATNDLGSRWSLDEFPATRYVLDHRVPGQVVAGDEAGDAAELAKLAAPGFGAVVIVPVVFGGRELAVLEVYRVRAQAFTGRELDRARVLAQQFAAALDRLS
jgi:GAF domain-containing protein